jgi:putative nucleotidyltransferase with HDIG domain
MPGLPPDPGNPGAEDDPKAEVVSTMTQATSDLKSRIGQIPMLSPCVMSLMQVTAEPEHSLEEVVRVVETDPVLTGQVIKAVNSAAFGLGEEITSVTAAISYLGDKTVVGIALAQNQGELYNGALAGYEAERGALWEHSLLTAIAARELAPFAVESVSPEVAYTGGLLHDIGKAVLSFFLEGSLGEVLARLDQERSCDFLRAEQERLGLDHCRAGLELARHWRLPPAFEAVCACHHRPGDAPEEVRPLVYIVHLADMVAMMGGSGTGADALGYRLDPAYARHVPIEKERLEDLVLKVTLEFKKVREMLGEEGR